MSSPVPIPVYSNKGFQRTPRNARTNSSKGSNFDENDRENTPNGNYMDIDLTPQERAKSAMHRISQRLKAKLTGSSLSEKKKNGNESRRVPRPKRAPPPTPLEQPPSQAKPRFKRRKNTFAQNKAACCHEMRLAESYRCVPALCPPSDRPSLDTHTEFCRFGGFLVEKSRKIQKILQKKQQILFGFFRRAVYNS